MSTLLTSQAALLLQNLQQIQDRAEVEACVRDMLVDVEIAVTLQERLSTTRTIAKLQRRLDDTQRAVDESRAMRNEASRQQLEMADALLHELVTLSAEMGQLKQVQKEHDELLVQYDEVVAKWMQAEENDLEEKNKVKEATPPPPPVEQQQQADDGPTAVTTTATAALAAVEDDASILIAGPPETTRVTTMAEATAGAAASVALNGDSDLQAAPLSSSSLPQLSEVVPPTPLPPAPLDQPEQHLVHPEATTTVETSTALPPDNSTNSAAKVDGSRSDMPDGVGNSSSIPFEPRLDSAASLLAAADPAAPKTDTPAVELEQDDSFVVMLDEDENEMGDNGNGTSGDGGIVSDDATLRFDELDRPILTKIFAYLDALDILNVAQINMSMYNRVDSLFGFGDGSNIEDSSTIATNETIDTPVTSMHKTQPLSEPEQQALVVPPPPTPLSTDDPQPTVVSLPPPPPTTTAAASSTTESVPGSNTADTATIAPPPQPTLVMMPPPISKPSSTATTAAGISAAATSSSTTTNATTIEANTAVASNSGATTGSAFVLMGSNVEQQQQQQQQSQKPTHSATNSGDASISRHIFSLLQGPRRGVAGVSSPAHTLPRVPLQQQQQQQRGGNKLGLALDGDTTSSTTAGEQHQPLPMNAAMANSMAAKLSDTELHAIFQMTERLKQKESLAARLQKEKDDLAAQLDGTEGVKQFLIAKVRDMEASLQGLVENEIKVALQIASDQEVIAFLDGRVQELERDVTSLQTSSQATVENMHRVERQAQQKSSVLNDMLQFEREKATDQEREWKATKKLLVKEVKNCRAQIVALQAERDGYREQNETLRRALNMGSNSSSSTTHSNGNINSPSR